MSRGSGLVQKLSFHPPGSDLWLEEREERAIENDGCFYYIKPRCLLIAVPFWLKLTCCLVMRS